MGAAGVDVPLRRQGPFVGATLHVVLTLVAAIAVRWPSRNQPLDRDMAAYATVGAGIWEGLLPYRDLFDHKQPLVYAVFAVIDLAGPDTTAVRVAAIATAAVLAVAISVLARPLLGRLRATSGGVLTAVVGAAPFVEGYDLNTEHLLAATSGIAVLTALRWKDRTWVAAAAGAVLGLAVLAKVVGVFIAPAVAVAVLCCAKDRPNLFRRLLLLGGASAAPGVLVLAIYGSLGATGALIEGNLTYNREYVAAAAPPIDRFFTATPPPIATLLLVGLVVGVLRLLVVRRKRVEVAALILWALGAWVGAKFGGRDFPHYFAPVVAPALLLILLPLTSRATPQRRVSAPLSSAVQAIVLLIVLLPIARALLPMFDRSPEEVAVSIYGEQARVWSRYEPVGERIRRLSPPDATLFVAGAEPGFYWFSGAEVAGRYPYDYPVTTSERRLRELLSSLCSDPPDRIVIPVGPVWPDYLAQLDQAAYELEFVDQPVHVYRRTAPRPCRPS